MLEAVVAMLEAASDSYSAPLDRRPKFQDAVDGIAAGQGDEGEDAIGAVFADGFDQEADGAKESEGGGPGIAPGAIRARHIGLAAAKKEERDEGEQVVGNEEEGEHGNDALETKNGERPRQPER